MLMWIAEEVVEYLTGYYFSESPFFAILNLNENSTYILKSTSLKKNPSNFFDKVVKKGTF